MSKVTWKGKPFDSRTVSMLKEAEKKTGLSLTPLQGSYSYGSLSGGTHGGGGAVDISTSGWSSSRIEGVVRVLRTVGFAAWYRTTAEGPWSPHIHAIAAGQRDLSPAAKYQVSRYYAGRNGLKSDRVDRHAYMKIKPRTWEQYRNVKPKPPLPRYPGKQGFVKGARGPHVKVIQAAFNRPRTGLMSATDVANVKAFQKKRPWLWPADGVVGPRTYRSLSGGTLVKRLWRV